MEGGVKEQDGLFTRKNESIRFETWDTVDDANEVALRHFARRCGAAHLFAERIRPTLKRDDAVAVAAVSDRPWPPWGLGAQRVEGLCLVHSVSPESVAVGPVLVTESDVMNINLVAALFDEGLVTAQRTHGEGVEVNFLAIDGAVLAERALAVAGFERSDDIFLTDEARYNFHRVGADSLRKHLGLTETSSHEILVNAIGDDVLDRNAFFHAVTQLGTRPGWLERISRPVFIPIDGGIFDASLPGGVGS
jgi:hypothetical protein